MTDFTSPPYGGREYMSSKQRTLTWVHDHAPRPDIPFYSPSIPPSPVDDAENFSHPPSDSDADSSHSMPPRMVLRYPDGRDIRISRDYHKNNQPVNHAPSRHSKAQVSSAPSAGRGFSHPRSRSGPALLPRIVTNAPPHHIVPRDHISRSPPQTGHQQSHRSFVAPPPLHNIPSSRVSSHPIRPHTAHPLSVRPQEDIRVLPTSRMGAPVRNPMIQSQVHHPGRPSLVSPIPQRAFTPSNHTLLQAPQVAISQSQPSAHFRSSPAPAPIAFSQSHPPSKYSKNARVPPSAIMSSHLPPGGNRHRSIPGHHVQRSRARSGSGARSRIPTTTSRDSWFVIDEEEVLVNGRREPRPRHPRYRHREDSSSTSSESPPFDHSDPQTPSSDSTYYVPASPGQNIKLLSPERSIYTATSTTKSPNSAHSPPSQFSGRSSGRLKRPFFSRLFGGSNEKKHLTPGPGDKRLFRRHSTGGGLKRG